MVVVKYFVAIGFNDAIGCAKDGCNVGSGAGAFLDHRHIALTKFVAIISADKRTALKQDQGQDDDDVSQRLER